jgi:hypothetical protein
MDTLKPRITECAYYELQKFYTNSYITNVVNYKNWKTNSTHQVVLLFRVS